MIGIGIAVTLLGTAISVAGVGVASSVGVRLFLVLLGIAVSLTGIMGIINRSFVRKAIWRK